MFAALVLLGVLGGYPVYIFMVVLPLFKQQKKPQQQPQPQQRPQPPPRQSRPALPPTRDIKGRLLLWLQESPQLYSLPVLSALLLVSPLVVWFSFRDEVNHSSNTAATVFGFCIAYQLGVFTLRTFELLCILPDTIRNSLAKKNDEPQQEREKGTNPPPTDSSTKPRMPPAHEESFIFESLPVFVAHFLLPVRLSLTRLVGEEGPLFKRHKTKERVLNEIVDTEKAYVKNLKDFQKAYHQGLLAIPKQEREHMLSDIELRCIFSNLASIIPINETLLDSLQKRVTGWLPDRSVGDIFFEMAPFLKEYTEYSNNFKKALDTFLACMERSAEFKDFIVKTASHPDYSYYDFNDYLIMPIQRVPRYLLLLKELIKNTDEGDPDKEKLEKALKITTGIADHINDRMHKAESMNKVIDIQKRFKHDEKMPPLVTATCRHVHDEEVRMLSQKEKIKRRHLFLFNEMMIVASFSRRQSVQVHAEDTDGKFRFKIPINILAIESAENIEHKGMENAFAVKGRGKSYIFGALTPEARDLWVKLINEQIKALHNIFVQRPRRETLRQPELEAHIPGQDLVSKLSKKVQWQQFFEVLAISPLLPPTTQGYRRITRAGAKVAFYFLSWVIGNALAYAVERTFPPLLFLRASLTALPHALLCAIMLSGWVDLTMGLVAVTLLKDREVYMPEIFRVPGWRASIREFWIDGWFTGPTRIGISLAYRCIPFLKLLIAASFRSTPAKQIDDWAARMDLPFGVLCHGMFFLYISLVLLRGWIASLALCVFFIAHAVMCWLQPQLISAPAITPASTTTTDGNTAPPPTEVKNKALEILLSGYVVVFILLPLLAVA